MPSFEITVREEFAAAHRLRLADGSWEPLHGHNWRVQVELAGPRLDAIGVLADFTDIRGMLRDAAGRLHDSCLNDLGEFQDRNPSAENVAVYFYNALRNRIPDGVRLRRVRVWETDACAAAVVADSETTDAPYN